MVAINTDKSVDTFEQNKCFLSASFRNSVEKNIFFVDSQTPLGLLVFNVEIRSVDTVTWLQHWKGERGSKCENLRWKNSCIQQNRSFLGSVSTAFVHDCRFCLLHWRRYCSNWEQGWCSAEGTCFAPVWPEFDSRPDTTCGWFSSFLVQYPFYKPWSREAVWQWSVSARNTWQGPKLCFPGR